MNKILLIHCAFLQLLTGCFGSPTSFPSLDDILGNNPDDGNNDNTTDAFRVQINSLNTNVEVGNFLPLQAETVGQSGNVTFVWSFSGVGRLSQLTGSVTQFSSDQAGTTQVIVAAIDQDTGTRVTDEILINITDPAIFGP